MRKIVFATVVALVGLMPGSHWLALANNAPIEDLSEAAQTYDEDRQMSADEPQAVHQAGDTSDDEAQPVHQTRDTSDENLQASHSTDDRPGPELASGDRMGRLEQQVTNMANMNLPQQIEELRQQIQQLNGQLQVQQRDIKLLESQQRNFYQDLNQRIQSGVPTRAPSLNTAQPSAASPTANVSSGDESGQYRSAFNLLVKKQYDQALTGFKQYLSAHPKGSYAANATYWMGELYLKQNNNAQAEVSFNTVIKNYPDSKQVPDAKLKLAMIHITQGKADQARQELQLIKRNYPNSTAAQLASIQLQRMS